MKPIFIFALIVLSLVSFTFFSCGSKGKDMPVTIHIESNGITITNSGAYSYSDVRVKLNNRYKIENLTLSGFEEKKVFFIEFSNSNGDRFNPIIQIPKTVYIAGEYQGEKYWALFKAK